jgi:hypothetical protein
MNKSIVAPLVAILLLLGVVLFFVITPREVLPEPEVSVTTRVYQDDVANFSITLPTVISSTTNSTLYRVDPAHTYTAMGPSASISGVRFTIPSAMASGTNLSSDTYVSVEHLSGEGVCDAVAFLGVQSVQSETIRDGTLTYSFASTTGAGAGNRYEEYVYAQLAGDLCIGVRYFIHSSAIENFPAGAVREFNKATLIAEFDSIRRTLVLAKQ